ncbi:hypothetical protein [Streptomyces sp. NPDC059071]|uniref:hypothetical protein n=1 Tax=unclassified Streptomyces TaxID=2593676 RepID=UPI0036631B41
MSTHPDLLVVHFTGRPRRPGDEPANFALGTAEERLLSILHSGALRGALDARLHAARGRLGRQRLRRPHLDTTYRRALRNSGEDMHIFNDLRFQGI